MQVLRGITQERASLERQSQLIEDVNEIRESNGGLSEGGNGPACLLVEALSATTSTRRPSAA
jgi:hypothetical protein